MVRLGGVPLPTCIRVFRGRHGIELGLRQRKRLPRLAQMRLKG
jgi:hypothetical protein